MDNSRGSAPWEQFLLNKEREHSYGLGRPSKKKMSTQNRSHAHSYLTPSISSGYFYLQYKGIQMIQLRTEAHSFTYCSSTQKVTPCPKIFKKLQAQTDVHCKDKAISLLSSNWVRIIPCTIKMTPAVIFSMIPLSYADPSFASFKSPFSPLSAFFFFFPPQDPEIRGKS